MQIEKYSTTVDADGVVHKTVGENIRFGAKGESDKFVVIDVDFAANSASEVSIAENNTGVTDLLAQNSGQYINFTSASHSIINVVGVKLIECDGAFRLANMVTNSSGALAIYIEASSAGDTARFKVYVKVDEY